MRKEEVIAKIGKKRWKDFLKFMVGQTVSGYPDGETDYYACDVENFMTDPKYRFFD